jgi:hypothetical protein
VLYKERGEFNKQFSATTSGLVFSDGFYLLQNHSFLQVPAQCFALVLMVSLWRKAQQSANSL